MKLNKTNCKLDICIKRRRVYFKNRFKYRKNRLLSLLLLIKTTFYIIFNTVNYKNISSFFKLSFCKKFFRVKFKYSTHNAHIKTQKFHTPDYSNVNTHRGSLRRSSSAPKSTPKCNEPDFSNVNTHRGSQRRSPNTSESTQNIKSPDYSNVNTRRGTRRRAPQATDSNNDSNMLDLRFANCKRGTSRFSPSTSKPLEMPRIVAKTPAVVKSQLFLPPSPYIPILTINEKFKCSFCPKEYKQNGRWLHNHLKTCIHNPININTSPKIKAFIRNHIKFVVNKRVKNFQLDSNSNFLKDFNITPCNRNTVRENYHCHFTIVTLQLRFTPKNLYIYW
jgi:hypothetical protein